MTVVGLLQYALSHDVCRAGEESVISASWPVIC